MGLTGEAKSEGEAGFLGDGEGEGETGEVGTERVRVLGSWDWWRYGDGVVGLESGRWGRGCEGVAERRGKRRGYVIAMPFMVLEADVEATREGGVRFVPGSGRPFIDEELLASDPKPPPASELPDETARL
jgi:hypothetical protein